MGLDPRIAMGVQPMQLEPRSVAMMRAMQMLGAERQNQLAQMQMQQMQQAGTDRAAQAAAQRNALAALPSPDMAAGQNALRGGGGPTMANAGRQRPTDPRAHALYQLAQAGIIKPEDYIATLDPNYGREEVEQYVERAGSDNTPEKVGVNRYGDVQGGSFRQPVKMEIMDNGGTRNAYNPYAVQPGQSFAKTMTPGEAASQGTAAARLAEDKRQFGITQAAATEQRTFDRAKPQPGALPANQKIKDAQEAIDIINQAVPLLEGSTGGFGGYMVDQLARAFSVSTTGAINAQKLKALEGVLVSKMPKMSGPQSDKDVALYRQMAAEIGDPTIPYQQKAAALDSVREIQERYAGVVPGSSVPPKPGGRETAPAAQNGGVVEWGSLK